MPVKFLFSLKYIKKIYQIFAIIFLLLSLVLNFLKVFLASPSIVAMIIAITGTVAAASFVIAVSSGYCNNHTKGG